MSAFLVDVVNRMVRRIIYDDNAIGQDIRQELLPKPRIKPVLSISSW